MSLTPPSSTGPPRAAPAAVRSASPGGASSQTVTEPSATFAGVLTEHGRTSYDLAPGSRRHLPATGARWTAPATSGPGGGTYAPTVASFPWQRDDVVQALRERLLAPGAVTEGFRGVDVRPALPGERVAGSAGADGLVVLFRWKLDPAVYAVRFHLEPAADGELDRRQG